MGWNGLRETWGVLHQAPSPKQFWAEQRAQALPLPESSIVWSSGGRRASTHNICTTAAIPTSPTDNSPAPPGILPLSQIYLIATCQNGIWNTQGAEGKFQGEKKNVNTGICSLGREVERDALTAAVSDSLRLFSSPALQKQTNSQLLETEAAHVRKKKNQTYQ